MEAPRSRHPPPSRRTPVYRPRHPERTALYRLLASEFQAYARVHEARFEPTSGPLRRIVPDSVDAYLACGRLQGGFARLRCAGCGAEHLLAFSCRTRNLCPSCQSKRSAVGAVWLEASVLLDVPHRHVVLTIPKKLRGLIERDRALHGVMARVGYDALRRALAEAACAMTVPVTRPASSRRENVGQIVTAARHVATVRNCRAAVPGVGEFVTGTVLQLGPCRIAIG